MAAKREHRYEATLTWTGASAGPTRTYQSYSREWRMDFDGKPALVGSADPTFRGDPRFHNPEELLLVALATCHMLSYLALCSLKGIAVTSYRDRAEGTMARGPDGRTRFTSVLLRPEVTIADAAKLDLARSLHHGAHEECFIANSVNFPVENAATVTVDTATA
ncbi:MAG: OsmC family protein [Gemmatimonas sp.]